MNHRAKAKSLVELAVHEDTPEKEKFVSALKAVAMIHKYDLLSSPLDGLLDGNDETISAAKTIFETLSDPDLVSSVKKVAGRFKRGKKRR